MKISLITVGKIKEKYFEQAIAEYAKRLSRYCKLEILQVADEKTPDGASAALEAQIKDREGERILAHVKDGAYVVALAIEGHMLSSEELAEKMGSLTVGGVSHIQFIIGGSLGLSEKVMRRAEVDIRYSEGFCPQLFADDISPSADAGGSAGAGVPGV